MKVPKARRLKSGSWNIQLRLGGLNQSVTADTKAACEAEAARIKALYLSGGLEQKPKPKDTSNMTLGEAMRSYVKRHGPALSPSTVRGYDVISRTRFQKYADTPVSQITDWQEVVDDELATASPKTVNNAFSFLRTAIRAETKTVIDMSNISMAQVPVKEIDWLQPDEIPPFLQEMYGRPSELAALILLHGLRTSEALALSWDTKDIDLKHHTLRVRGAKVRGIDGWVEKNTNKNRSSTRSVPIMLPRLFDLLKAEPNKSGPVIKKAGFTVYKAVRSACKRAGVTIVSNHGLRHTFASVAYKAGLNERQLMDIGGWSDYQTMHRIYIRLAHDDQSDAASKVQNFLSNL